MTRRRDPRAPLALVVAVLLVGGGLGPSIPTAIAAPAPPSWDDVEAARGDVEATQIAIERITEQAAAQAAELETVRTAAIEAGEKLQAATDALAAAEHHLTSLERQHDAAAQRADASGAQAAQLAAQLARAGGGDVTMALIVSGDDADALLYRLGTVSALTARVDEVLARAVADRNAADALAQQAATARTARADAVAEAEAVQVETTAVAIRAERRAAAQQALLDDLAQKLAVLTGRSAEVEREYLDSLEHGGSGGTGSGGTGSGGTPPAGPSPSPSAPAPSASAPPAGPTPSPSAPAPSPSAPGPSPSPSTPPAPTPPAPTPPSGSGPTPNAAVVAAALAFARAQLGEPYRWGAAGPDAWDCSGLTMMAYSAGGLAIGGHSVSAQYNRAASRGLLVPYAQAMPGDLIFYSYGGSASGSKYHVAIYLGNGQMLEAPSAGKPVRIVTVRTYDRIPVVARPSG